MACGCRVAQRLPFFSLLTPDRFWTFFRTVLYVPSVPFCAARASALRWIFRRCFSLMPAFFACDFVGTGYLRFFG